MKALDHYASEPRVEVEETAREYRVRLEIGEGEIEQKVELVPEKHELRVMGHTPQRLFKRILRLPEEARDEAIRAERHGRYLEIAIPKK